MTYRFKNIVLAVGLAVVAALLVTFYVANYRRSVQTAEESVTVYVAAKAVAEGTSGTALAERKLLRTEEVPRRAVVPGAISDPEEVAGYVVADTIFEGEQITKNRFRTVQEQGIRAELSGNMRAIQVAGDPNQLLAGTLKRGDRVDVVVNLKYKVQQVADVEDGSTINREADRVATRIVLRDLLVLNAPPASPFATKVTGSSTSSVAAQLALTDSQAQKMFFVMKNGDWALQLRPVVDPADSPDSVETIESVLADGLGPNQFRQLYAGRRGR